MKKTVMGVLTPFHIFCLSCISLALLFVFTPYLKGFMAQSGQPKNKVPPMSKKYIRPSEGEIKKKLTPEQYKVTQENGTEPAFNNAYWDNKEHGIYVDIVSGEPLFSSLDKFDSGTGWPSFTRPLAPQNIVEREEGILIFRRTEIRSKYGDSHLGHVFKDGPAPTGLRYCMNSAALRFVPVDKLEEEGYGEFRSLFASLPGERMTMNRAVATLAGGCFWGVEDILRKIPGVLETTVGYTGGRSENPDYELVKQGQSGHAEAVQVVYDPQKITYEEILHYFFRLHDPTTLNRQGNDRGTQYRSAIFYHTESQREAALKVKADVEKTGRWKDPIVTEIVPASKFYKAEDYHQDYLVKNPRGYTCHYLRD